MKDWISLIQELSIDFYIFYVYCSIHRMSNMMVYQPVLEHSLNTCFVFTARLYGLN